MKQPLAKINPAMLALMHGSFAKDGALMPFTRETVLVECHIAGLNNHSARTVDKTLTPGTRLTLKREPDNRHDNFAIMILTETGQPLGYVPRAKNEILARLMDAGKQLFAKLESKSWQGEWLKAETSIYLRDV
jgi:hypothetical protein